MGLFRVYCSNGGREIGLEGLIFPILPSFCGRISKGKLEKMGNFGDWSPKSPRKHQRAAKKWPKFQNIMENRPCSAVQYGFWWSEKRELSFETANASDFVDREYKVVESLDFRAVVAEAEGGS